ncbi:MAG: DUF1819 family protein [Deltaproteobacteria bacterium]|nr:DUF1819 family protein [Deltaproteobacteria bacterium]
MSASATPLYNARLIKGGALLGDIRLLVRGWQAEEPPSSQKDRGVRANVLAKPSRSRTVDVFEQTFLPRFVVGPIPEAWRLVRALEDRNLPLEVLRPVYYWITARSEPILYDYATQIVWEQAQRGQTTVRVQDAAAWIRQKLRAQHRVWSDTVVVRVAQGLLSTLRDFGVVEGRVKKRIAPAHLAIEAFAFVAFALHLLGVTGARLVDHSDWRLFLLAPTAVERLFFESHQHHLLTYHAAGRVVRLDFAAHSPEGMADVVAARTH